MTSWVRVSSQQTYLTMCTTLCCTSKVKCTYILLPIAIQLLLENQLENAKLLGNQHSNNKCFNFSFRYDFEYFLVAFKCYQLFTKFEDSWANFGKYFDLVYRHSSKICRFVNFLCMNLCKITPKYSLRPWFEYLRFRQIWRILFDICPNAIQYLLQY